MMKRTNNWLLTAVKMGLLAWSGATLAADKVYVANEGADTVSVLDALTAALTHSAGLALVT